MADNRVKTPIEVDGSHVATLIHDETHPEVVWAVYGPQYADQARAICLAVLEALDRVEKKTPSQPALTATQPQKSSRNYTKAIREEITNGLSDDEIWELLKAELDLTSDKKYRIKEVRKESSQAKTNQVL